jgi:DNA invertase Pin-like site-specific DNA recombinase
MANDKVPCIIYAAKSTEDKHGSIQTQLDDCRAMAERMGWEVIGEFSDEGFSAYSGNRGPGLEDAKRAALSAARDRGACVFLPQHSDRVARGAGDAPGAADHLVEVVAFLRRGGVSLRTVQDDFFGDERIGLMMAAVQGQRNTEDSRRKSEAVKSGKRRAFERGDFPGGPIPDGFQVIREVDERQATKRRVRLDHERGKVIRQMGQLADSGCGDPTISQELNQRGLRTRSGKPWTRRHVQDLLSNPIYYGGVVWHRGKPDEEINWNADHPVYWDQADYERRARERVQRDLDKGGRKKASRRDKGGRPTTRHALAKLGVCDRCGGRMYAVISTYKRKDGTQARHYVCANVHNGTGLCDQPPIDAEKVDTGTVAGLDDLFLDFDRFLGELSHGADQARKTVQTALDAALAELDQLDANAGKHEADYARQIEAGDETRADLAARNLERTVQKRESVEGRIEACRRDLESLEDPADTALDTYNELRDALRGAGGRGLGELNERLREEFEEFRLDTMDNGVIGVLPVLRKREFDWFASYTAWLDAGKPEPTPEQTEEHRREAVVDEPIWAEGKQQIRPPAKALAIPNENPPHSHE